MNLLGTSTIGFQPVSSFNRRKHGLKKPVIRKDRPRDGEKPPPGTVRCENCRRTASIVRWDEHPQSTHDEHAAQSPPSPTRRPRRLAPFCPHAPALAHRLPVGGRKAGAAGRAA